MRLSALTLLILQFNGMLDSGKYDDISIEEVKKHIDDGSILRWLHERTGLDFDTSLYSEGSLYTSFEDFYVNYLQAIYDAYGVGRRKWGVENKGLCLLIAWTNEIVQQGEGWKPNTDIARR